MNIRMHMRPAKPISGGLSAALLSFGAAVAVLPGAAFAQTAPLPPTQSSAQATTTVTSGIGSTSGAGTGGTNSGIGCTSGAGSGGTNSGIGSTSGTGSGGTNSGIGCTSGAGTGGTNSVSSAPSGSGSGSDSEPAFGVGGGGGVPGGSVLGTSSEAIPLVPNTGAGGASIPNTLLLIASGAATLFGSVYLLRSRNR